MATESGQEINNEARMKCNDFGNMSDLVNYYDDTAHTYDKEVNDLRGYVGPEVVAKILDNFLNSHGFSKDCRILDVGSGTGISGEQLSKLGYRNIDGLDPSEKSLDIARTKNVYKKLIVELFEPGRKIHIQNDEYDAINCVGVFTKGHVTGEAAMGEMVRIVKRNGLICFSIRGDVMFDLAYGYEAKMAELCDRKCWELVSKSIEQYHSMGDMEKCHVFTYKVC